MGALENDVARACHVLTETDFSDAEKEYLDTTFFIIIIIIIIIIILFYFTFNTFTPKTFKVTAPNATNLTFIVYQIQYLTTLLIFPAEFSCML